VGVGAENIWTLTGNMYKYSGGCRMPVKTPYFSLICIAEETIGVMLGVDYIIGVVLNMDVLS
jgi:hypothetical protein